MKDRAIYSSYLALLLFILIGGTLHGLGLKDKTIYSDNSVESGSHLAEELKRFKEKEVETIGLNLFSLDLSKEHLSILEETVSAPTLLKLDLLELRSLFESKSTDQLLEIKLPFSGGGFIELEMFPVKITSEEFQVTLATGGVSDISWDEALFYRGICKNKPESLASFSFFRGQVVGMFSDETGNYVLAPYKSNGQYILYNAEDLQEKQEYTCLADDLMKNYPTRKTHADSEGLREDGIFVPKCVEVYMECDFALFLERGGVQETVEYIFAVFNAVATLYQNEQVTVLLSEVHVWNTKDMFSTTSSVVALNQFRASRQDFNGDIAHLVSLGGRNLGGVAWLDVLCHRSFGFGYSNIRSTFNEVPLYSWTVEVITHEIGHNLGSRHTQWCGWDGGPLDDCFNPEGNCERGPTPMNGGTIMSYCHLTQHGINFANGFGFQPGNKIRERVAASDCINSCYLSNTPTCTRPTGLKAENVTSTSAGISWSQSTTVDSFQVEYQIRYDNDRVTSITLDTNVFVLSGLTEGTEYVVRIRSYCSNTAVSEYSTDFIIKTPVESSYCQGRANSANMQWISMIELGDILRVSGNDGGYYDAGYLTTDLEAGSSYILKYKADHAASAMNTFWRVWIDFDGNGSFADAGELIFGRISNTSNALARVIQIPANAKPGVTRMRIAMKHGSYPGPCEVFGEGEVEDYTVVIKPKMDNMQAQVEDKDLLSYSSTIFPNPVSDNDQVFVQYDSPEQVEGKARIVNVFGMCLREQDIAAQPGQNLQPLEVSSLKSGAYILQLQFGNRVMQHNFIVQ
jgi:hypothetical protein